MADEPLRQLLQRCTVRLNVGGEYGNQGTGFFVAPGLILTCAHVVEVEGTESSVVKVFWREESQKKYEAKVEQVFNAPDIDLALLKLTTDPPPHPCVRLKQDVPQLHDQLYIFGYPKEYGTDYSYGDSATLIYEGESFKSAKDDSLFLKLKEGEIKESFSGSPLLNLETGDVCGIVNLSRNTSAALGGRAVPTRVIFSQLEQLVELQQQFHQNDKRWAETAFREHQSIRSQTFWQIMGDAIELGRVEGMVRTTLAFPSVIGGAIGAGLGLGILRAVIALTAHNESPCLHFAMSFFSASILGTAITLGMALAQSGERQVNRLRHSEERGYPIQKQASVCVAISGALFFGIAHAIVALMNGLPVLLRINGIFQLSPQVLLVVPMGFVAGLGLSIVLYDQPWLGNVQAKRCIPHPNRCGLRLGLAALAFTLIQGVFILAKFLAKVAEENAKKEGKDIVVEAATGTAIARTGEFYKKAFSDYKTVPGWQELMQLCPQWFDYFALLDAALVGMVLTLGIVIGSMLAHRWSVEWLKLINRQKN